MARIKERQKKEEVQVAPRDKDDVYFNDQTGKLYVNSEEVIRIDDIIVNC